MPETAHILIVEDEPVLLEFLVYHVEQAGYRATSITSGGEIFGIIEREPPDLILLDLGLPDGDGLTRAQQVRERSDVPIMVLSARQGADDRLMALGLGADDYLTKPCDPRELLLRIRNILGRGKAVAQPQPAPQPLPPQAVVPPAPPLDTKGAPAKSGFSLILFTVLVLAISLGGGATWMFMSRDKPQPTAIASPQPSPPPEPASPASPALPPTPRAVPEQPTLDVSVTAKPAIDDTDIDEMLAAATDSESERQSPVPTAAKSYAWVLKSKCAPMPDVGWWRFKQHTDLVRYVNRRYRGDWVPYIQTWVKRLSKLQGIYGRNSAIKTNTGVVLKGPSLKTYIDQTQSRLDITICLSREAAEFAYRKSLQVR